MGTLIITVCAVFNFVLIIVHVICMIVAGKKASK